MHAPVHLLEAISDHLFRVSIAIGHEQGLAARWAVEPLAVALDDMIAVGSKEDIEARLSRWREVAAVGDGEAKGIEGDDVGVVIANVGAEVVGAQVGVGPDLRAKRGA